MRKRNYTIAALLSVIGALAMSGAAWAAPTSPHGFTAKASPTTQGTKKFGGINVTLGVDEIYTGGSIFPSPGCLSPGPGCTFFPPATRWQFFLPEEWRFSTGRLPKTPCQPSQLDTQSSTAARQVCSRSLIGTGSAIITLLNGQSFPGQVSAFVGGSRLILIQIDVSQEPKKRVLVGNLVGRSTLDVTIEPIAGTVIDDFNLEIPKKKVSGKRAKKKRFFTSARCTDGSWTITQLTTFQGGMTSSGTPVEQTCAKAGK